MTPRRSPPSTVIARRAAARRASASPLATVQVPHIAVGAFVFCIAFLMIRGDPVGACTCPHCLFWAWHGDGVAASIVVRHSSDITHPDASLVVPTPAVAVALQADGTFVVTVHSGGVQYRTTAELGQLRDAGCAAAWLAERPGPAHVSAEDGVRTGDVIRAIDALAVAGFASPAIDPYSSPPHAAAARGARPFPSPLLASCRRARRLVGPTKP